MLATVFIVLAMTVIKKRKVRCKTCLGAGIIVLVKPESLRAVRESACISIRAMADKLDLSAPYLSDIERGRRNCTSKVEKAYAKL